MEFRLLRIEIEDEVGSGIDLDLAATSGTGSWTTVITGKNGAGKSRLLSAIVAAFETLDGRRIRRREAVTVGYQIDGRTCEFRAENGKSDSYLDGKWVENRLLPRPGAIVAATASAFDKFALPRETQVFGPSSKQMERGRYKYLGLKDMRGRVSARAGVMRALEQLFDANSDDMPRRRRVADVFGYLGYEPKVEVIYSWTNRARRFVSEDGPINSWDVSNFLEDMQRGSIVGSREPLPRYFFEDNQVLEEIAIAIEKFRKLTDRSEIRLIADFSDPRSGEEDQLHMARQLTRAGLIGMTEVVLMREPTGVQVEVADASSGELSLVVTLLGIASSIQDGSLVLIDEPEISLHPQWQSEYLDRLGDAFSEFKGCHFLIASHSPTLVSGASPEHTSIIDLERRSIEDESRVITGSVDEVLFNTFRVVSKDNLYLREVLVTALRAAEDGDLALPRFDDVMLSLQLARRELSADEAVRGLIDELLRIREVLVAKGQS